MLGWNGVLARLWRDVPTKAAFFGDLGLVWLWVAAGVLLVAMIFRSTPFFNAMSILGITLGVTVLITVQSVMNGFSNEYERVFIETQGNLDVRAGEPIKDPQAVVNVIKQVPGVICAEPEMNGVVMMLYQNLPATPLVRTFDMNSPDAARDPLANDLLPSANFEDLDDQSVFVGSGLAGNRVFAAVGRVDVYSLRIRQDIKRS